MDPAGEPSRSPTSGRRAGPPPPGRFPRGVERRGARRGQGGGAARRLRVARRGGGGRGGGGGGGGGGVGAGRAGAGGRGGGGEQGGRVIKRRAKGCLLSGDRLVAARRVWILGRRHRGEEIRKGQPAVGDGFSHRMLSAERPERALDDHGP